MQEAIEYFDTEKAVQGIGAHLCIDNSNEPVIVGNYEIVHAIDFEK